MVFTSQESVFMTKTGNKNEYRKAKYKAQPPIIERNRKRKQLKHKKVNPNDIS